MSTQTLSFIVALATAILLTPLARNIALRLQIVDQPHARKIHATPTPLLGGLAIYVGLVLAVLLSFQGESWQQVAALLAGATFLVLVGVFDDHRGLAARLKLLAAIPLAGLILAVGGIRITAFPSSPFWAGYPEAAYLASLLLTILWVAIITAAFTILDYMDGLCAGIAAVACCFFLYYSLTQRLLFAGVLSAAMMWGNPGFSSLEFPKCLDIHGRRRSPADRLYNGCIGHPAAVRQHYSLHQLDDSSSHPVGPTF
jgi:UDP-GlcNAc:undecaprenyl-phosphate GlcNAc-1-phosphate transferase